MEMMHGVLHKGGFYYLWWFALMLVVEILYRRLG
jgi:hypothetical protein